MSEDRRIIIRSFHDRMIKSLLDVLILKDVEENNGLTGYKIMTRFNEKLGVPLSSGTIYANLYSLERRGLLKGDSKGRSRIYTLTNEGKNFIKTLLSDKRSKQFIALLEKPLSHVEKPDT